MLGQFSGNESAGKQLAGMLDKIKHDDSGAEYHLDILLAAEKLGTADVTARLARFYSRNDNGKPAFDYQFALQGGDAEQGRKVFFERSDLSCVRCHTIGGSGGNVGPNLSGIGLAKSRQYLLDSIVHPNKEIAEGFSERIYLLDDGQVVSGIVQSEDDDSIALLDKDGVAIRIAKEAIDQQKVGQSSMPTDLIEKISLSDLRDLIEYLAAQKAKEPQAVGTHGH
jgi:quinoprotein glucose dehydrogenase